MPNVVPTDLFQEVLEVLGVQGSGEAAPTAADADLCRRTFNRLTGQWNVRKRRCYFIQTQSFTFPRIDKSYTIGLSTNTPTPDFQLTGQDRPSELEQIARLILTGSSPNAYLQLAVVNFDQYQLITVPTVATTVPNTLYYQPTTPNGTIFIWPEPTVLTNKLEVSWRNQLTQITAALLSTPISMPDGYEEAITLTLAEKLWLMFPKKTNLAELSRQARNARADAFGSNSPPPKIDTTDGATQGKASGFNWLTRLPG